VQSGNQNSFALAGNCPKIGLKNDLKNLKTLTANAAATKCNQCSGHF
jgi:hypothetical protein